MRVARMAVCSVALSVALWSAAAQSQAQATDPLTGTWTLDVAKSKVLAWTSPKERYVDVLRDCRWRGNH